MKIDQERLLRDALHFSEQCEFTLRNDIEYLVGIIAHHRNTIEDVKHKRVPPQEHHPVKDLKRSVRKGMRKLIQVLGESNPHFVINEYLLNKDQP